MRAGGKHRDRHPPPTAHFADGLSLSSSRFVGTLDEARRSGAGGRGAAGLVQQALARRCKKSKTRGRPGASAEVILRMMLLKHFRDWSVEDLTRELRANLVYREFTRIGGGRVPSYGR
jgi:hypothetical protein